MKQSAVDLSKAYVISFRQNRDPLLEWLNTVEPEYCPAWMLAASAMYQGKSNGFLTSQLQAIRQLWHDDVFKLPVISQQQWLNGIQNHPLFRFDSVKDQIPGIFWSIARHRQYWSLDFLKNHEHWNDLAHQISNEIFFMGKKSALKNKPRLYLTLAGLIYNEYAGLEKAVHEFEFPVFSGLGSFFIIEGIVRSSEALDNPLILKAGKKFYHHVYPHNPAEAAYAFSFFRYGLKARWSCVQLHGECGNCGMDSWCHRKNL